jgi:alanine dehydrogenase
MSEVAGRMSIQAGASALKNPTAGAVCCWAACPVWNRGVW